MSTAALERRPIPGFGTLFKKYVLVFDGPLALIIFLILMASMVTMYSAGIDFPGRMEDHLRNSILAFLIMWAAALMPTSALMRLAVPIYTLGIILLVAVATFGLLRNGARRWVDIGIVIQPSELIKISLPLMLAWYFQKHEGKIGWPQFVVATILLLIPVVLILEQPDLGTALLVLASGF